MCSITKANWIECISFAQGTAFHLSPTAICPSVLSRSFQKWCVFLFRNISDFSDCAIILKVPTLGEVLAALEMWSWGSADMISNSSLASALQLQKSHRDMLEKLFSHSTQIKLYKKPNIFSDGGLQKIFFFSNGHIGSKFKNLYVCVWVQGRSALWNRGKLQF